MAVSGTFAIPDAKLIQIQDAYRTRVFRLTSSSTNDRVSDIETAGADYIASTLETVRETIVSTREPRLVRENTNERNNC